MESNNDCGNCGNCYTCGVADGLKLADRERLTHNKSKSHTWQWRSEFGEFTVDTARDVIINPGKFEGEPRFVLDFWNCGLNGCADDEDTEDEDCPVWIFSVDTSVIDRYPLLKGVHQVRVWEDSNGFVRHEIVT